MRGWTILGVLTAGVLPLGCPLAECALVDCETSQIRVTVVDLNGQPFLAEELTLRIDGGTARQVDCDEISFACTYYLGGQFENDLPINGTHTYLFEAMGTQAGVDLIGEIELTIDFDSVPTEECCGKQVVRETTVPTQRAP